MSLKISIINRTMKNVIFALALLGPVTALAQESHLSMEKIWAERDSAGTYTISASDKTPWKIFKGETVGKIDWSKRIAVLNGKTITVSSTRPQRVFFAAVNKKDTLYFAERRLAMDAAPNFRDLGGLKTSDGRTVKWDRLFRCGDMGKFTDTDLQAVASSHITDVVDFRNMTEIQKSPDKYPAAYEMNRIHANIGSTDGKSTGNFMKMLADPKATTADAENTFAKFYPDIMLGAKDYQLMFDELLKNSGDEGLLFHCSAGKDRTGVGSALILSALNVPEETIIEEYYLSNRYTRKALTKDMVTNGLNPEIAQVLSGVEPRYLQEAFRVVKEKYGSVHQLLEKELGIDEAKRIALIGKYTY